MTPGGPNALIQVPMGAWHTCRSLESGSVILEFKNTKYDPIATEEIWLKARIQQLIEDEARSCSMEPGCITPEYVYRMWGGEVPLEEIKEAFDRL